MGRAKTLLETVKAPVCLKTLTIAGAPVPGGLQGVICDLIEVRFIHVIVTTGSQIPDDLVEALGFSHDKGHHTMDDVELRDLRIDRMDGDRTQIRRENGMINIHLYEICAFGHTRTL